MRSRMLIVWRGTCAILTVSLLCILAFASRDANACRFTIQHSITFAPQVSELTNQDRLAIAGVIIDVNNSVAKTGETVIYAYTEEGDPQGTVITKRRVDSVVAYLRALGVEERRINVDYGIWHVASNVPASERFQVMLEFVPGPGTHPC